MYENTAKNTEGSMDDYSLKMTKSIHEYKEVIEGLGIDTNKLGCVMLPVEPKIDLLNEEYLKSLLDTDDLYTSSNEDHFWIKGDVTNKAHVSLLYGLMTPAYEQAPVIDKIMQKWTPPKSLIVSDILAFPSPYDDENYCAIVAKVYHPSLEDAHARLSYLPHVNTHSTFNPHVTLFYVKASVGQYWVDVLRRFPIEFNVLPSLDYGSER